MKRGFPQALIINNNAMKSIMIDEEKCTECAKRILANLENRRIRTSDIEEELVNEIIEEIAQEILNIK